MANTGTPGKEQSAGTVFRSPNDPLLPIALQEHSHTLVSRARNLLRFLTPLAALLTILTASGLLEFPRGTLTATLVVETLSTLAFGLLLILTEREERQREWKEPSYLGKQVPLLLATLLLAVAAYLSILGLRQIGWGVIFAFGLVAVSAALPMPLHRVAPLFALYYAVLLVALFRMVGDPVSTAAIVVGSGASMILALFINYEMYRQSVEAIHRNLVLQETNSRLSGTIERNRQLLSIVSHDVRAPLGSIVQLFDFVDERRERFSPEELAEIMGDVTASLRNSYQLLDNLLSWARSVSSAIQIRREPYPLDVLLHKALQPLFLTARRKNVRIQRELDLGLELVVDRRMMEVSFRNFISNAVKFTESGGTVTIRGSHAPEDGVAIEITDTGIGMSSEEMDRLLREDENPTSRVGTAGEHGSGLGFELARHFVDMNAGTVALDSAPGKGTTVTLHLPGRYNQEIAEAAREDELPSE